jgi:hypothetical protein
VRKTFGLEQETWGKDAFAGDYLWTKQAQKAGS